jgi:hypothetical protein
MKTRTAPDRIHRKDAKYAELIDDYLVRIKEARVELCRSKGEIDRMKAASRRKLMAIDAVLKAC